MIKIVYIVSDLSANGAQIILCDLVSSIDRSVFSVEVISLTDDGSISQRFAELNIPVHTLKIRGKLSLPRTLLRLRRIVRSIKPDLLQGWMPHGNLAASFSGSKVPVLWSIHNSLDDFSLFPWMTHLIIRICARISYHPAVIIYVSRASAKHHEAAGYSASKTICIPNGFNVSVYRPNPLTREQTRDSLVVSDGQLLIGLIARYHPMKDHDTFLQAAALFLRKYPATKFVLVGQGVDQYNCDLMTMIDKYGLLSCVILLGERMDVPTLLTAFDIVTCSSLTESFPLNIGEAMACGIPCVVTDVGDCAFIVGEVGNVVPPQNPVALASAWGALYNLGPQKRQCLGAAARQRVIELFSIDVVAHRYEKLWQYVFDRALDSQGDINMPNYDQETVRGFGDEWARFDQSCLSAKDHHWMFEGYFSIFPWNRLPENAVGFDLGCGSGRWAKLVAPRVGQLYCIDPSTAIDIARQNLVEFPNCTFHRVAVDAMPMEDASMDFGYCLGVLHHVQNTQDGIAACARKLKPGAPLLLYLYYAFDNKPRWYRMVWQSSNLLRSLVSRFPFALRYGVSQIIACLIYLPLARFARSMSKAGFNVSNFPLSAYRDLNFYSMRTDALDRFGTRLEQRFSRKEIKKMMKNAGLSTIHFSPNVPFWCAVGYRSAPGTSKH